MGERMRAVTIGWLSLVGLAVVLLAATALSGWLLPAQRSLARSIVIAQPVESVWVVVAARDGENAWNPGVARVQPVPGGGPVSIAEGDDGAWFLVDRVIEAGCRLERRRQRFSGDGDETWTIAVDPSGTGTRVTLTCRREIQSPFARCWARLGDDQRRIERALAGLAKHFGQSAAIDNVPPDDEESHAEPPQAVPVR